MTDGLPESYKLFKDMEDLQKKNQLLMRYINALTIYYQKSSKSMPVNLNTSISQLLNASSLPEEDLSEEEVNKIIEKTSNGETPDYESIVYQLKKQVDSMKDERLKQQDYITSIIKQRDMYKALLAQVWYDIHKA